jgi:hypothetical protein
MTKAEQHNEPSDAGTRVKFWQWVGILLPPIAWGAQLQALYLTSEYGCRDLDLTRNHVVSVAALVFSIVGGIIANGQRPSGDHESNVEEGRPAARKRFMGLLGVVLAVFFTVVIFAQWLPTLVGVPCGK